MTELLTRPEAENTTESESEIDNLNAMFDSPNHDDREPSPLGTSLVHAANRINTMLTKRVVNRAHSEGLAVNDAYDHTVAVNEAHDEALGINESESQAAYDRSHDAAIAENRNIDHVEALAMNKAYDKNERREARAEKLEQAKQKLRGFGRSALTRLKNAGLITLGAGVAVSEAAGRTVKSGAETAALAGMIAKDKVVSAAETGALQGLYAADKVKETASNVVETMGNKFADAREKRSQKKIAATERRAERRARWSNRLSGGVEAVKNGVSKFGEVTADGFMSGLNKIEAGMDKVGAGMQRGAEALKDTKERAKVSLDVKRAAGAAALEAFRTTQAAHREQNKL